MYTKLSGFCYARCRLPSTRTPVIGIFFGRVARNQAASEAIVNPVVKSTGRKTRNRRIGSSIKCGRCFSPVTRRRARFNHLRFNNHRRPHRRGTVSSPPPCPASVHRRTFLPRSWESRSAPANKLDRPKRISHLHRPD